MNAASLRSFSTVSRALAATIGVVTLLVCWPIFMWTRVQEVRDSNLGFQLRPEDPFIAISGLLWLGVLVTLISLFRAPRRVPNSVGDLRSGFQEAVAASYFGVGDYGGWTATNPHASLHNLEQPDPDSAEPPSYVPVAVADVSAEVGLEPEVAQPQPSAQIETVEYVCGRRESWWSISEKLFGDPQEWSAIRDLNLGRTVSDGVRIDEDTVLRSGWTLLVPKEPTTAIPSDAP